MTNKELLVKFKNEFPFTKVSDFRPICHELFTDGRQGITIWLEDGSIIEYYPMTKEEEAIKMLRHCEAEDYCYDGTHGTCKGCNKRAALDMAIEALKAKNRPIICPRCGRTFSEAEGRER